MNHRPELSRLAPDASPEEAAAVVAAIERFMRETGRVGADSRRAAWLEAALREGVARAPELPPPWA